MERHASFVEGGRVSRIAIPQLRRTPELRFRVLLGGDAEAGEEYMAKGPYMRSFTVVRVHKYKNS